MPRQPPTQSPVPRFDFTIDLSYLSEGLKSNFSMLWQALNKQADQIQLIKDRLNLGDLEPGRKQGSVSQHRTHSRNISLNYSALSGDQDLNLSQSYYNPENGAIAPGKEGLLGEDRLDAISVQDRPTPNINKYQNQPESNINDPSEMPIQSMQEVHRQNRLKKYNTANPRLSKGQSISQMQTQGQSQQINQMGRTELDEIGDARKQGQGQASSFVQTQGAKPEEQKAQLGLQSNSRTQNKSAAKSEVQDTNKKPNKSLNTTTQFNAQTKQRQKIEKLTAPQDIANLTEAELIQRKILQLNERLEKVELAAVKESSIFSKKMNQIHFETDKLYEGLMKKQNDVKKLQHLIETLRGQLSEFKLKKQAKLMRMASKASNGTGADNQFNEMVLDKLHEITLSLPLMMLKQDHDDFKQEVQPSILKMEKKLNNSVTTQQFNDLLQIISRKAGHSQGGETDDPVVNFKLLDLEKTIKNIQQYLQVSKTQREERQGQIKERLKNNEHRMQQIARQVETGHDRALDYEKFMKDMNESYNEKIREIINQIVQTQENVEKLNSQMKTYTYAARAQLNEGENNGSIAADSSKVIDIDNDLSMLKKKVNKIALKMQTVREDLLAARQDLNREIDGLKVNLQKKCDWESLKKSMNFLDDRYKDLVVYIQRAQQPANQPAENGQSTAAKRGWTCLCCDKDIKQYEGKLGEAKFTSIFPARYESPRIGGYYKQKQVDKEYKQVFMKPNRRLSQNQKSSRDDLIV